jgi:hypothetical protein
MFRFARLGVLGAALLVSACAFEKTVLNEGNRNLDASGIVAGRSNILDVVQQLGVPVPDVPEEIGARLVSSNYLNYTVFEQRCFRIGFDQIFVITPFRWCYADHPYELAVEFDDAGTVTGVYETRKGMIWRPFQSESDLPPPKTVELSGNLFK